MTEQKSRLAIVIDSTGAEKQADSLSTALNKMTQAGENAAASGKKVTKATEEEKVALSELLDRIDPVNAALNKLDKQQKDLAKAKAKGFIDTETFDVYSKKIADTRNKLTGFSEQLNKTGVSSKQTAAAMRMVPAQMTDIIVSLQGGQAPLTVLLQQGGQLKDMFGGIVPAAKALGGYVAGLINPFTLAAGAVGVLGLAYYKGSQEQDEFNKSLILTGNLIGKTSGELADIASRAGVAANSTTGAAAAVLNQLVASGKIAGDSLEGITGTIVKVSELTGIATEKLISDFDEIAKNPVEAITKLNDKYHFLTAATYDQIKALQEEGNQQEAARIATETYSASMSQRADSIKQNLGTLENAWLSLAKEAKGAWDAMLSIGREVPLNQRIEQTKSMLDNAKKDLASMKGSSPIDTGNYGYGRQSDALGAQQFRQKSTDQQTLVDKLQKQLDLLQSEETSQNVINGIIGNRQKEEDRIISLKEKSASWDKQLETNAKKRSKAIKEQDDLLKNNIINQQVYAERVARINDMYKDPAAPKEAKGKSYTEDAATRLLDQLNQQTSAMQSQLETSDKLTSVTQQRIKFEQKIADLKEKKQLTADQKSLLSRSDEIMQAYKVQEAVSNQVKTLDDYRKMQEAVVSKDERTNDLLKERLSLLEKAKATGQLKPGEYEKTRSDIFKNTSTALPSSVQSVVGNMAPSGGQLSGTFGGLQQQFSGLDKAQQELDAWLAAKEAAYAEAGRITADGEASLSQIRANAAMASQTIETQKNEIIKSATQSMMDSTVSIMRDGYGEQSAVYKLAFAASKAFAIAQSIVAIQSGIAQAAANPFPMNLLAMASVAANTASIVSNIQSVAANGFMTGGYTGNMATNSVAGVVHGKEFVFDAAATKKIGVSNLEALRNGRPLDATLGKSGFGTGAQNVSNSSQSNVYNFSANLPPVTVNGNPSDATIQLVQQASRTGAEQGYRRVVNEIASGKGEAHKALVGGYNTSRRAG